MNFPGLTRSKYVVDPSVQSNTGYGQTSNLYTLQSFGGSQQQFSAPQQQFGAPQQQFGAQSQPFGASVPNQSSSFNQNQFVPFTPAPVADSYLSGIPPIEVAQQALPQSSAPPPSGIPTGWNDPPPCKPRANNKVIMSKFVYFCSFV